MFLIDINGDKFDFTYLGPSFEFIFLINEFLQSQEIILNLDIIEKENKVLS